jgi:hypothetical protein
MPKWRRHRKARICAECCESTPYYADFEIADSDSEDEGGFDGQGNWPSDPPPYVSPETVRQPGMIGWEHPDPEWKYRPGYVKPKTYRYPYSSPIREKTHAQQNYHSDESGYLTRSPSQVSRFI